MEYLINPKKLTNIPFLLTNTLFLTMSGKNCCERTGCQNSCRRCKSSDFKHVGIGQDFRYIRQKAFDLTNFASLIVNKPNRGVKRSKVLVNELERSFFSGLWK